MPNILNSDQGYLFTSEVLVTGVINDGWRRISIDCKSTAIENMLIELLLRSVKYEYIYANTLIREMNFQVQLMSHDHVITTLFCGYLAERSAVYVVSEMQIFTYLKLFRIIL